MMSCCKHLWSNFWQFFFLLLNDRNFHFDSQKVSKFFIYVEYKLIGLELNATVFREISSLLSNNQFDEVFSQRNGVEFFEISRYFQVIGTQLIFKIPIWVMLFNVTLKGCKRPAVTLKLIIFMWDSHGENYLIDRLMFYYVFSSAKKLATMLFINQLLLYILFFLPNIFRWFDLDGLPCHFRWFPWESAHRTMKYKQAYLWTCKTIVNIKYLRNDLM